MKASFRHCYWRIIPMEILDHLESVELNTVIIADNPHCSLSITTTTLDSDPEVEQRHGSFDVPLAVIQEIQCVKQNGAIYNDKAPRGVLANVEKGGGLCQISCTDYNHGWSCRRRHFQEIVGIPNIDKKFTNEQIQIIEARESERNASSSTSTIAAILAFKRHSKGSDGCVSKKLSMLPRREDISYKRQRSSASDKENIKENTIGGTPHEERRSSPEKKTIPLVPKICKLNPVQ
ncbi:unnamed protein product [Lepeophtheirus salmonis]|uniref:(salmon louse) hypothetical protein n=1 Tax=Lepeophtheirus salmonis TaxID=72036 RepID=A0A7R8CAP5_LEPSM|nr:unnamed protein product [Lepeophtheirus salmonis]CAF2750763.1 unnamed protein product [Lepeophtheirus salmonis]